MYLSFTAFIRWRCIISVSSFSWSLLCSSCSLDREQARGHRTLYSLVFFFSIISVSHLHLVPGTRSRFFTFSHLLDRPYVGSCISLTAIIRLRCTYCLRLLVFTATELAFFSLGRRIRRATRKTLFLFFFQHDHVHFRASPF